MTVYNGVDFSDEIDALRTAAIQVYSAAGELAADANRLAELMRTQQLNPAVIASVKYRTQKMRIHSNDIGDALSEIEEQAGKL